MRGRDHAGRCAPAGRRSTGRGASSRPRTTVAEPKRRQHVQLRRLGPAIVDADLDQDVFGRFLGVFHEHVEITVLVEDARVEQFVLELLAAPSAIGFDQVVVRVGRLRILVEVLHVRVRRRAVEIEVVLLHVLAVIALAVGQAEQPLLEDGVLAVPEREREAEPLPVVGDAGQSVLAPVIGARARLVVAEVVPGVAVVAVVLAHRAPLPLAEIGSPFPPRGGLGTGFLQATTLGVHLQPSLIQVLSSRGVARLPWATHATRSV